MSARLWLSAWTRRAARRPARHTALAHWRGYGLQRAALWPLAEYGWQLGLNALERQWVVWRPRGGGWWPMHMLYSRDRTGAAYKKVQQAVVTRARKEGNQDPWRRGRT